MENLRQSYLEQSHVEMGTVYRVWNSRGGKHALIGVDSKHKTECGLDRDIHCDCDNYVILRVSDKYPRVFEVLEWKVTKEAIEKYFPSGSIR